MKESLIHFSTFEPENTLMYIKEKNSNIWIANMSPVDLSIINNAFINLGRILFESLYLLSTPNEFSNIGIKEVCVNIGGIDFFKDIFPSTKVILIARNPVDIWRRLHKWKSYNVVDFFTIWKKNTLDYFNSSYPFIWYENLIQGKVNNFLSKSFNLSEFDINNILSIQVGGTSNLDKKAAKNEDIQFFMDSYADVFKGLGIKNGFTSILP